MMQDFANDIEQCLTVLQNGGLILYPTDTVWGIGCDATNESAVAKIYNLKQRIAEKSMIVLLTDENTISQYVSDPSREVFSYLAQAVKPTTVIYDAAVNLAPNLINADGSIAIRIVKDEFCRQLIRHFQKPIVSTSANISGEPSPGIFAEITGAIKNGVDYIVQHRRNETIYASPSAIIKWNNNGSPTVIRP